MGIPKETVKYMSHVPTVMATSLTVMDTFVKVSKGRATVVNLELTWQYPLSEFRPKQMKVCVNQLTFHYGPLTKWLCYRLVAIGCSPKLLCKITPQRGILVRLLYKDSGAFSCT